MTKLLTLPCYFVTIIADGVKVVLEMSMYFIHYFLTSYKHA